MQTKELSFVLNSLTRMGSLIYHESSKPHSLIETIITEFNVPTPGAQIQLNCKYPCICLDWG